ncbi:MAG TPA: hypothetical protein VGC19_06285 [Rhodanobacter sp.]
MTKRPTRNVPLIIAAVVVLIPVIYVTSCSVISGQKAKAFERVRLGDTEQQVIGTLGAPADREPSSGPRLIKYGVAACIAPCAQRLWYPNSISVAGEAWSVELDASGHVVRKAHLTSP